MNALHGTDTPEEEKSAPAEPPLRPRTSTFSEADQQTLDRFSKDISDYTGRTWGKKK